MKMFLSLLAIFYLLGCTKSHKYEVGDCITPETEDHPPATLFYKVTAVNEAKKTYSITTLSIHQSEKSKMIIDAANKLVPDITFAELESDQPQGSGIKYVMTKVGCP